MTSRRRFLTSAAVAAAVGTIAAAAPISAVRAQGRPKTYVLVHGAWHGGWCWQRVSPLLRARGHDVHTPTLTGLGDRAHLARPETDLDTHIQDVIATMEMEGLVDVTLVGHSYAGFVISGVADRAPSRIASLVYLDAFVPENGKSLADYVPADRREGFVKSGEQAGFRSFPVERFGVTDPADAAWVSARLVNQPFRTFTQKLSLMGPPPRVPRTFIFCSQPSMHMFDHWAAALRNNPAWKFHEMKTGHDAMITQPRELARILLAA